MKWFLIFLLAFSAVALAVNDTYWIDGNGEFTTAGNWDFGVPNSISNAWFTNAINYEVTLSSSATVTNLQYGAKSGVVTNSFSGQTLTMLRGLDIGTRSGETSTVVFVGGTMVASNNVTIGGAATGTGVGSLTITNGAVLVCGNALVSSSSVSRLSSVLVTGAGSFWNITNAMTFGYDGTGNSLTIANGGVVANRGASIAEHGGGTNTVLVTGAGSVWSNKSLIFGRFGPDNSLTISAGGNVSIDGGLDTAAATTASRNSILVTGAGSFLGIQGTNVLGLIGISNTLVISDGAVVTNNNAYIGYNAGANYNSAVVTGTGSAWTNLGSSVFTVGRRGMYASLMISNGGAVYTGYMNICGDDGSTGAVVTVTGPGSILTNTGGLDVGYQTTASDASLFVSNSGKVYASSILIGRGSARSKMVISEGGFVSSGAGTIGGVTAASSNSSVLVTGSGSLWTNTSLTVGSLAKECSLIISNGGVVNVYGSLSIASAATTSNKITVTGAGSLFSVTNLFQAIQSPGHSIIVEDAGTVVMNNFEWRGCQQASAIVRGPNSVWTNTSSLSIGRASGGSQNTMTVSNRGSLWIGSVTLIGNEGVTYSNRMVVADSGSVIRASSILLGGYSGGGWGTLVVSNGGLLNNTGDLSIGNVVAGKGYDYVLVTDSGSIVTNTTTTTVGGLSSFCSLNVSNGASYINGGVTYVGSGSSASNNLMVVTDPNTYFKCTTLAAGSNSVAAGNGTLRVLNGATVECTSLISGTTENGLGTITNSGGVFQFATLTPTVTTNQPNGIVLTNGTVSHRAVASANISTPSISNIIFQGSCTFRLNAATNLVRSAYAFSNANGMHYQNLELVNDSSTFRCTNLVIGAGGYLMASNAAAAKVVCNSLVLENGGSLRVTGGSLTVTK